MHYTVYVDSNNRNQNLWPNSNSFTLHLTNSIQNITKAELVSAMLPNVASSQFLVLDIHELRTPMHLTADALVKNSSNVMTPTSNSFGGAFATLPVKVSGTYEFYNQNYRITTQFPKKIDKLDRLTISWRQPNNGSLYYDSTTTSDLGRTMFLLRFETDDTPMSYDRGKGLPDPVQWDSGEKYRLVMIVLIALVGLFVITSIRRRVAINSLPKLDV